MISYWTAIIVINMFRIFEITDAMICMGEILRTRAFNLCDRFANLQSQVFFPTAHVHFFIFIFGCFYFFPRILCLHLEIFEKLDAQPLLLALHNTGTGHVPFKIKYSDYQKVQLLY